MADGSPPTSSSAGAATSQGAAEDVNVLQSQYAKLLQALADLHAEESAAKASASTNQLRKDAYRQSREGWDAKLAVLDRNMTMVRNRLQDIEQRLTAAHAKAEEFALLQRELKSKLANLEERQQFVNVGLESLQTEKEKLKQDQRAQEKEKETLLARLVELNQTHDRAVAEMVREAQSRSELDLKHADVSRHLDMIEQELDAVQAAVQQSGGTANMPQRGALDKQLETVRARRQTLSLDLAEKQAHVSSLQGELKSAVAEKEQIDRLLVTLDSSLTRSKARLQEIATSEAEMKRELRVLSTDAASAKQKLDKVSQGMDALVQNLERMVKVQDTLTAELSKLEDTKKHHRARLADVQQAENALIKRIQHGQEHLKVLTQRHEQIIREKIRLEGLLPPPAADSTAAAGVASMVAGTAGGSTNTADGAPAGDSALSLSMPSPTASTGIKSPTRPSSAEASASVLTRDGLKVPCVAQFSVLPIMVAKLSDLCTTTLLCRVDTGHVDGDVIPVHFRK